MTKNNDFEVVAQGKNLDRLGLEYKLKRHFLEPDFMFQKRVYKKIIEHMDKIDELIIETIMQVDFDDYIEEILNKKTQ